VAVAWVGDTSEPRLSRDARDAARATIEHDRIVSRALNQGVTPIPASLADPYEDDAAVGIDLRAHASAIEAAFPLIADRIEMTTIVALRDSVPATDAPGRGTAYLEQIRSAPSRAASVADRIADSLKLKFPNSQRRAERGRVALSHLIPRDAIDTYRTLVLANSGSGYRIVIDGPRAPYSFSLFSPRRGIHGMILAS
jgi:hypothetical protein